LLIRSEIVEIAQAGSGAAHKAASFALHDAQHSLDDGWIKQHIIVEIVYVRRGTLFKQEVALFGHTASRQVAQQRHAMSMPAQRARKRRNLDTFEIGVLISRLIGNNHIEIREGLAQQARQRDRQPRLAAICWNENINERHDRTLPETDYQVRRA